ncbi:hypothetical protein CRV11_02120 [Candidatus Pantoea edessiphila]|uniref:Uncharacterized protein n=1 Tax=Candidatus Pantoea edessiphila TaxID=2044610 RepID=A0A2P5SYC2_9GAMM|nr:hypothetical protein [Candidatus Pantoea edessiphila]MBK4775658.1 hypothetical protein [Pantoea sp. Edef]PPI87303.1 hypothetical protein CRV11_02120 [Candidatus Pantoea edessiphila]
MSSIEPNIGKNRPCFIYHILANQSILSEINRKDYRIAERFEIYYKGIENGCVGSTDFKKRIRNFKIDNQMRIK